MAIAYGYQMWRRDPVTRAEPYINGVPMSGLAPWGGLHTKTFLHGDDEATWSFVKLPSKKMQRLPIFRPGQPVDIKVGPCVIAAGVLAEPDWDQGQLTMLGAPSEGDTAMCFTSTIGETTTKPNLAVDQAIARGALGWVRRDDFGATAIGTADGDSSGLTYVTELLDAWADENNSGWAITPRRELIITGAPVATAPRWFITPGVGELGQADDDRIDRIFVRYEVAGGGGALATESWPLTTPEGGKERGVLITNRGPITSTKARAIATGIFNKLGGKSGWTNGITVDRTQISTPGGLPARLEFIRAGDTMRLLDVPDPRGLDHHLDVVIGDTDLDHEADSIVLNPTGMAKRSLEDVLTQDYANDGFTAL